MACLFILLTVSLGQKFLLWKNDCFEEFCKIGGAGIVVVGDTLETDIQGGLNAGLKATVWINKNGVVPLKSSPTPHYIVSSVLELPALLHSIDCKVSVST